MISHRVLRLAAAGLLIGAVAWTLAPQATSYVSTSAVVNAPLISIKSPIDGRIGLASAGVAHPVASGETLLRVEADAADRSRVEELRADAQSRAAELDAKDRQYRELSALRDGFAARERAYHAALAGWLDARIAEIAAERDTALATRDETGRRIARSRDLAGQGALAQANLDHDEAELARAEAAVAAAEARLAAARRERAALDEGVQMQGEASYSRSRIDEVTLRLTDLEADRERLAGEQVAIAARLASAEQDSARQETFAPTAAARGVVWRASGAPGAAVLAGDEILQLLDCERRFIEVAVPERHFDAIRPGSSAWVQLRGSPDHFEARVAAVRGSGGKFSNPQLAAEAPDIAEGQLRVLVALDPPAPAPILAGGPDPVSAAFCDVGRTAEVRFDRGFATGATQVFAGLGARLAGWFRAPETRAAAR